LRKIPAGFLAEFLIAVLSQHQDRFFAVDRVEGPRLASRPPAATVFKIERCHIVKGQHSIFQVERIQRAIERLQTGPALPMLFRSELERAYPIGPQEDATRLAWPCRIVHCRGSHLVPFRKSRIRTAQFEPFRFVMSLVRQIGLDDLSPFQNPRHFFRIEPDTPGAACGLTFTESAPADFVALEKSVINSNPFYSQRSVNLQATPPQFGIGYINLFVIKASIFEKPAIQTVTLWRQDVLFHHGAAQPQPKKSHHEDTKTRRIAKDFFASSCFRGEQDA